MGGQTTFAARTADRFLLANFRKESTTYGKESDKQHRSTQKTTNRTQQKTTNRTTNTTNTTDSKNSK